MGLGKAASKSMGFWQGSGSFAEAEELEGPDPAPAVAWPASAPAETCLVATPAMAAFPAASAAWKRSNMASKARMSDLDLPFWKSS